MNLGNLWLKNPQKMRLAADVPDCVTEVRFKLTDITTFPGFCINKTAPGIDDAGKDHDFSFDPGKNLTLTNVVVSDGKAVTDFYCKDYGGKCKLITEYLDKDGNVLVTSVKDVPIDENNNGIADAWEKFWVERNNAENIFFPVPWSLQLFQNPNWDSEFPNLGWQHTQWGLYHADSGDGLTVWQECTGEECTGEECTGEE